METKSPSYRALPFIFAALLILVGWINNLWLLSTRDWLSSVFNPSPVIVHGILAPIFFAFAALLLLASVFNGRLTRSGSITFLVIGILLCLMPLWNAITPLGTFMSLAIGNYLPLAGAVIAVSGFAGLVVKGQPA